MAAAAQGRREETRTSRWLGIVYCPMTPAAAPTLLLQYNKALE